MNGYPSDCLGACYGTVAASICPAASQPGGGAGGGGGAGAGVDIKVLQGLAMALQVGGALQSGSDSAAYHKQLQLAGMQYFADRRLVPPANFQQLVLFLGMSQSPHHMQYLAEHY
jgi:hypothetical protein